MKVRRKAAERESVGDSSTRVAVRPFFAHALSNDYTGGIGAVKRLETPPRKLRVHSESVNLAKLLIMLFLAVWSSFTASPALKRGLRDPTDLCCPGDLVHTVNRSVDPSKDFYEYVKQ